MRFLLLKLMKCLVVCSVLLFSGLQSLVAQGNGDVSADNLLLQVYKTIDGKAVIQGKNEVVNTRSVSELVKQENDDLQSYLDNIATIQTKTTITKATTVVDLSQFTGVDRTRPLYVRSFSCVFINGTLSRNPALQDSAVLVIEKGCTVEWGKDAILSGGGFATGNELVLVENGSFSVSTGTIKDSYCESTENFDKAVFLKSGTSFEMTGGLLSNTGGISNQNNGSLSILGGVINGGGIGTKTDFLLSGTADITNIYVNLFSGAKILVKSALQKSVDCVIPDSKENLVVATGTGSYSVTQSDVNKLIYSDPDSKQTKEWEYALVDRNIVLKEKSSINDEDDLQHYLDGLTGKGTEAKPEYVPIPEKGITVTKPLKMPEGYIHITGGPITFSGSGHIHVGKGCNVWFEHIKIIWIVSINICEWGWRVVDGGTVTFGEGVDWGPMSCKYGVYVGSGSVVNIYGGTISGCEWGLFNSGGTINLYGGTITGNSLGGIYNGTGSTLKFYGGNIYKNTKYDIYSLTCFWLNGSCNVSNIWLGKGVCIYITSGLKYKWEVHFIDGFDIGKTIILGDGYTLRQEDIIYITIYVPDNFTWYWEQQCGCIHIKESGSNVIDTQEKLQKAIDEASGTCSGNPTVIEISGAIKVYSLWIKDKSIKLTGGTLVRALTGECILGISNGCLTLEDIVIDGNMSQLGKETYSAAIVLSGISNLVINKGTVIKNHYITKTHDGVIWSNNSAAINNKCTVIMNGGSICDNETPDSELITDNDLNKLSFTMNGGSIYDNTTGYGVVNSGSFIMNAGSIRNNSINKISMNEGSVQSDAEITGSESSLYVSSVLQLAGTATVNGRIILGKAQSYINLYGALNNIISVNHDQAAQLAAGTVVVRGYDGYKISDNDLSKISYASNIWKLELNKSDNTIVLKAFGNEGFKDGDDLQEYLDGLAREGKKGTEEDPILIDDFLNPLPIKRTIDIPAGMSVRFHGGELLDQCMDCGATINIPKDGFLYLNGTTVKAGPNKDKGTVSVDGKFVMEQEALVDYVYCNPKSIFVLDGGTMGSTDKIVDCGTFDLESHIYMKKGQIGGNIVAESNIDWDGVVKIRGCVYFYPGCRLNLMSTLQANVKIACKTLFTLGDIVACGTGGYQLTTRDLNNLIANNNECRFELKGGNIVVADLTTDNDQIITNQISAVASNGTLVISGLVPGDKYVIYNMKGSLIYEGKAENSSVTYHLPSNGIYLIRYKDATLKVVM